MKFPEPPLPVRIALCWGSPAAFRRWCVRRDLDRAVVWLSRQYTPACIALEKELTAISDQKWNQEWQRWHRFLCWVWGCELSPLAPQPCERCGLDGNYDCYPGLHLWGRVWWRYDRPRWLYRRYWKKCRDCGGHFDQHSPDCPPF